MKTTVNNNRTIEYDEKILCKIREIIENGLTKLKLFVNSKTKPNLNFFKELDKEFDEITSKLEELELWHERRYFLSIKRMVLYIVHENSIDKNFGHCAFTIELLNFFIDLFKTNISYYKKESGITEEEFKDLQKNYQENYYYYRQAYYQNIYENSGTYSEEELYESLKRLNG